MTVLNLYNPDREIPIYFRISSYGTPSLNLVRAIILALIELVIFFLTEVVGSSNYLSNKGKIGEEGAELDELTSSGSESLLDSYSSVRSSKLKRSP
jgi:hypothetical protein